MSAPEKPHPKLVELSDLLVGSWRVDGPGIAGRAEYRRAREGRLLVSDVDFSVRGSPMKVIQHIAYDQGSNALRARYMDTMGDEATYVWVLDDGRIRVSLENEDSDTYFEATLNEDNSQYVGTWHYPEGAPASSADSIVYTRVSNN